MYEVTLKKIESMNGDSCGETVYGLAFDMPEVGNRFFMYVNPLDNQNINRYIHTTPVHSVEQLKGELVFKTNNSVYVLVNVGKANVSISDN